MPVTTGKDSKGCFAKWGSQKKYYYKCGDSAARERAKGKAQTQGRAIRSSGYTHVMELNKLWNISNQNL